jgi:hypothetical protein
MADRLSDLRLQSKMLYTKDCKETSATFVCIALSVLSCESLEAFERCYQTHSKFVCCCWNGRLLVCISDEYCISHLASHTMRHIFYQSQSGCLLKHSCVVTIQFGTSDVLKMHTQYPHYVDLNLVS